MLSFRTLWSSRRRPVSLAAALLASVACASGELQEGLGPQSESKDSAVVVTGANAAVNIQGLTLSPTSATLAPGASKQFNAIGWINGSSSPAPNTVWGAEGGQITQSGLYTAGSKAGTYRIAVKSLPTGHTEVATVIISGTAQPAPTVSAIVVTPGTTTTVNRNETQQYSASATLSNGTTQPNAAVSWTATGGTISTSGLYRAGTTAGNYRVVAAASNGRADTSLVTIPSTTSTISSITVAPATATVAPAAAQQFTASAKLSNGSTQSNPAVTWTATGGTVTSAGRFTAGSSAGSFRVIASSSNGKADTSAVTVTVVQTPPPPPPSGGTFANKPSNYTRVLSELDMSMAVPSGAGNERYVPGLNNVWSVIYDGSGTSNWTRMDDPTAPHSRSSVWQLRFPKGTWSDGHGSGNLGRALPNVNEVYVSYWIKWDSQFEFHTISSKHLRFEKSNGNFLIQARHNNNYFRASDEGIGTAYEPQDGSQPALGVWHQVEVLVRTGSPGTVKVWIDGQIRTNYTNLPVTGPFRAFSIDGHLGGGGMTKTRDSFYWIDHLYIATP